MEVASIPEAKFRPEEVEAFSIGGTGATAQQFQLGSARFTQFVKSAVLLYQKINQFLTVILGRNISFFR